MATLGYATVGSNDLPRALQIYDAPLGSAGIMRQFDHPTGGRIYGRDGVFFFGVIGPFDGKPATAEVRPRTIARWLGGAGAKTTLGLSGSQRYDLRRLSDLSPVNRSTP
jgi:hypothetical protein